MWSLVTIQEAPKIIKVIVDQDNTATKGIEMVTAIGTISATVVSVGIALFSFRISKKTQEKEHKHALKMFKKESEKELIYKKLDVHDKFRAFRYGEYITDRRNKVLNDTLIDFLNEYYTFLSPEVKEKLNAYNTQKYTAIKKGNRNFMPMNVKNDEQKAIIELMDEEYETLKKKIDDGADWTG